MRVRTITDSTNCKTSVVVEVDIGTELDSLNHILSRYSFSLNCKYPEMEDLLERLITERDTNEKALPDTKLS